jgi:hypothetical protein
MMRIAVGVGMGMGMATRNELLAHATRHIAPLKCDFNTIGLAGSIASIATPKFMLGGAF